MEFFNNISNNSQLWFYFLFWICIIGLCCGSFYNVVILRSISGESIVFPASKCPKCQHKLYFWHNIPILSYILLRGKCYFCKEPISIQYPIIEFITMVLFALTYIKFGLSLTMLFTLFWLSCLLIMTVTDIKTKLVDCSIAIAMGISGLIYNFLAFGKYGLLYSFLGMLVGIIVMELVARSGYLFVKTRAMGEADTYVAGALGAIFGKNILLILLLSLIASMIFVLPVFLYNQFKANNKKTCILSILFILTILIFQTVSQSIYIIAILAIIGILLSISILSSIGKVENRNYLPYVPALAMGALYFLLF